MPNKLKDSIRHKFTKKHHNKRDWKLYDQSLINRGNITIWFDEDAVKSWNHVRTNTPDIQQQRGRVRTFSDLSIQACHVMRTLFKQPLRQTEGVVCAIIKLLGLDLKTPDHTTISRRLESLKLNTSTGKTKEPRGVQDVNESNEPKAVVIDSTGIKVVGEKEWMNYKYATKQRKVWRKLHAVISDDGIILASTLTTHTASDTSEVGSLLDQIDVPISEFLGDGGYDHLETYEAIDQHNANQNIESIITIPPNIGFRRIRDSDHDERKKNQSIIDLYGRENWQKQTSYGRRSSIEGMFSRWKRVIGSSLKSKNQNNQIKESEIGVFVLNKMLKMNPSKAQRAA